MIARNQALRRLQDHADEIKETDYHTSSTREKSAYQSRVEGAAYELSVRVSEEQASIEKLQTEIEFNLINEPSPDPRMRLCQLTIIKSAYDELSQTEPDLPLPYSPLPAVLAVRNIVQLLRELEKDISHIYGTLKETREYLAQEEADLEDSRLLTIALEKRLARLELEIENRAHKTPHDVAQSVVIEQQDLVKSYERGTRQLVKAFLKFINNRLALLLAAEELGGPVVGDLLDVTDELLKGGFHQRGRSKKLDLQSSTTGMKRQQRIDSVLDQEVDTTGLQSESKAAAAAIRSLVEELLNTAAEAGAGVYVKTSHESAVSRFLVRAKVAQFHPKDARKLRLIDHGQDVDTLNLPLHSLTSERIMATLS